MLDFTLLAPKINLCVSSLMSRLYIYSQNGSLGVNRMCQQHPFLLFINLIIQDLFGCCCHARLFLSWPDLFRNQAARALNDCQIKLTMLRLMTAKKPYSVVLHQQAITEILRELFKLPRSTNPLSSEIPECLVG